MRILTVIWLLFCMFTSPYSQDFWMPTSILSSGSDWVPSIKADSRGTILASSWQVGMFRTTNNGLNWIPSGLSGKMIYHINEGPDSSLFAITTSTSGPVIYRSTDDGQSWNSVYVSNRTNNYFYGGGIVFMDNNIVVSAMSFTLGPTVGDIGVEIVRSSNGGTNWQLLGVISSWGGALCLTKLNDGRILAATTLSGISYSTNNGSSWQPLASFPPIYTNNIKTNSNGDIFVSRNTAASSTDLIFRSTDNGSSWQGTGLLGGTGGGNVRALYIDNTERIYASVNTFSPSEKKIYRSTNNGASWNELTGGMPSSQLVYSLTGNSQDIIFAGTQSSGVYKGFDNLTGNKGNQTANPVSFGLGQNYPNPFNPVTAIEYSLPNSEFVSIKIYDITGKEIYTLVNGFKQAGVYKVSFDVSLLSSGIYFYRMESGIFSNTRKMILVK